MPCPITERIAKVAQVLALALPALPAPAYVINNQTPTAAICAIFDGTNQLSSFPVNANSSFNCPLGAGCNPNSQTDHEYTLAIVISQAHGPYETYTPLHAGGTVSIRSSSRPWTIHPDIHVQSFDTSGTFLAESYPNFGQYHASSRDVQFLASADCQYMEYNCCNLQGEENPTPNCTAPWNHQCPEVAEWNANSDETHLRFRSDLAANPLLRGIIVAGDLTQGTNLNSEWLWYLSSWQQQGLTLLPYVYDGLGNHDYGSGGHETARA